MSGDYRELVIQDLAESEAALRADVSTLVELVADLTIENFTLRCGYQREHLERVYAEAALHRHIRRDQHGRRQKAAA